MLKVIKTKKAKQKKIATRVILILAFVIFLCYIPRIFSWFSVKIENAVYETVTNEINANAVIIRDEILVENNSQGFLKFNIKEGEKVQNNEILAKVYDNKKDIENSKKFDDINKEIEFLNNAKTGRSDFSQGFSWINNQINDEIKKIKLEFRENDFSYNIKARKNIRTYICEKLVYLGKSDAIKQKVEELEKEKSKITESRIKFVLTAPVSGYFVNFTDGFEDKFNYKKIFKKGAESFEFNVENSEKKPNIIGKIIKSDTWFMIFETSNEKAEKLKIGTSIPVSLSNNYGKVMCKVKNVLKSDTGIAVITLSCGDMNENLAKIRKENIKIELSSYSGFKIKKDVIHQKTTDNGQTAYGVYVKVFSYIKFKKVKPIYYFEDYVICEIVDEEDNRNWLQIGDKIIVQGRNLYDGKKV